MGDEPPDPREEFVGRWRLHLQGLYRARVRDHDRPDLALLVDLADIPPHADQFPGGVRVIYPHTAAGFSRQMPPRPPGCFWVAVADTRRAGGAVHLFPLPAPEPGEVLPLFEAEFNPEDN